MITNIYSWDSNKHTHFKIKMNSQLMKASKLTTEGEHMEDSAMSNDLKRHGATHAATTHVIGYSFI